MFVDFENKTKAHLKLQIQKFINLKKKKFKKVGFNQNKFFIQILASI